ncbi:MAG: hypothetical protein Ct9H300mP14_04680 [Gammaproteobacteria bacterium]|nr:MAG: hypothetical protein Ct9H300mP14_04680 [Gammaproteobacteria bacterium]
MTPKKDAWPSHRRLLTASLWLHCSVLLPYDALSLVFLKLPGLAHSSTLFMMIPCLMTVCRSLAQETLTNYPDLVVPYHSRWRHFETPTGDLSNVLLKYVGPSDQIVAVLSGSGICQRLLDAGAGAAGSIG